MRTPLWAGAVAAPLALIGCANPIAPSEGDYLERLPTARTETIDPLGPERFERETPSQDELRRAARALVEDPFAGVERMPMTIEQVRAATLENNLDVRVAVFDPAISGESLRAEEAKFEAVFRPSIRYREDDSPTFDITASNQQDSANASAGVDIPLRTGGRASVDLIGRWRQTDNPFVTFNTSYDTALQFSLSHPLLRNAGRRVNTHSIRVAQTDDMVARVRTKLEVIRQLAGADRAYWRLDAAQRALEVAQRQFELADEQLQRARRLADAGEAPRVEIIRAEAGLAERLEAILIAEKEVLDRQREVKRLMNVEGLGMATPTLVVTETDPAPTLYEFDAAELIGEALANRMEMLELELQLAADVSSIDFAKNQALPLLTLDYSYSINGLGSTFRDSGEQLADNSFESWDVGLSGSVPIGNEAAKARVRRAVLTRLRRLATKDARAQAIEQEVLQAIDQVTLAWQRILAARQSVVAAARTLEAEQNQFDAGVRTSTDVLDASARLADQQLAEIRALADYQIALVDLAFATGTLLGSARVSFAPVDAAGAWTGPEPIEPSGVESGS